MGTEEIDSQEENKFEGPYDVIRQPSLATQLAAGRASWVPVCACLSLSVSFFPPFSLSISLSLLLSACPSLVRRILVAGQIQQEAAAAAISTKAKDKRVRAVFLFAIHKAVIGGCRVEEHLRLGDETTYRSRDNVSIPPPS